MSSTTLYGSRIAEALQAQYGERRHAAKIVARKAGSTERAARNWLAGTGPQAATLIRLMAREPAIAEVVAELVERQRRLDAELAARRARRRVTEAAEGAS